MTCEMSIMTAEGDTKLIWSPGNADEVAGARHVFDNLKSKGYLAYRVVDGGGKGEIMREFDANAEKVILCPPLKGG